jgi:hypothetical protein
VRPFLVRGAVGDAVLVESDKNGDQSGGGGGGVGGGGSGGGVSVVIGDIASHDLLHGGFDWLLKAEFRMFNDWFERERVSSASALVTFIVCSALCACKAYNQYGISHLTKNNKKKR